MSDASEQDLSLVTTDAMVAELRKRFDALLIIYESRVNANSCTFDCLYSGGVSYCIGLAERGKHRLIKIALENHKPYDGE